MLRRTTKLKLRRLAQKQQKQVEDIGSLTDEKLDKHFFRRLARLIEVRRFVVGWLALMLLLILTVVLQAGLMRDKFQKHTYVPGGVVNEGIVGTYTNANPIYATSSVDASVSKLVFAGLFKYDDRHHLVPDLAESINIDEGEKIYTVKLKPNLTWQDGKPLTAKDAVFTFRTIQNPDSLSHLLTSWQGIRVEAKDDLTVIFTLPNTLSSFPHSLTTGLIPEHVLGRVSADRLRSSDFNTIHPIGAGPFSFDRVEVRTQSSGVRNEHVGLIGFENYHGGKPGLNRYIVKTFEDQSALEQAYTEKNIDIMSDFGGDINKFAEDDRNNIFAVPVTGQKMVFFKTSSGVMADSSVRKALVLGSDRKAVIESTGAKLLPIDEPLLISQTGYDKNYAQKTNDINAAKSTLDQAGWKMDPSTGIRTKDNQALQFRLVAAKNNENTAVVKELEKEWRELGANVKVSLESDEDQKATIASHNYDALLYSISIGADPDVYAFWHSSQFDARSRTRLNFSEYSSPKADSALQAGRSRSDPAVRSVKYKPFLEAWSQDNPALALYQPQYIIVARSPFNGFSSSSIVTPQDRYGNVDNWMVRYERR